MLLSNCARHQSSRTAYIAYAGELLRLRQHAVLQYAAEVLMLRFEVCEGQALVSCAVSCEARNVYVMREQYPLFLSVKMRHPQIRASWTACDEGLSSKRRSCAGVAGLSLSAV